MKQASTIEKTEEYFLILRGAPSDPVARMKYIDDAGAEQTITQDVMSMSVRIDRDDERETDGLFIPPASTMTVEFSNVDKQFVNGFGGTYDGVITRGRRFLPEFGHKISAVPEYFEQGLYISDDPTFGVDPSATVTVTARDYFGLLVDTEISLPAYGSIKAELYIEEILKRAGLLTTDYEIQVTNTTLVAPAVDNQNASELLSQVMQYLQLDDNYRLVMRRQKITLEIPSTNALAADYVFHWLFHIAPPYTRRDDTLKLLRRLTVQPAKPTVSVGLAQGTITSKTEADMPYVHSMTNSPAIHIAWKQGEGDTLEIIETARTLTTVTFDRRNPTDTGSWTAELWGDKVTGGTAAESADGENIRLNRGKTSDVINPFVQNATDAKALADAIGVSLFSERVRAEFRVAHGWLLGEINDLVRTVEKYSNDKRLYHLVQLTHSFTTSPARLDTRVIAEFAGLVEIPQAYDSAFQYDTGRIYDEQHDVGDEGSEDTSFRGAVRTTP